MMRDLKHLARETHPAMKRPNVASEPIQQYVDRALAVACARAWMKQRYPMIFGVLRQEPIEGTHFEIAEAEDPEKGTPLYSWIDITPEGVEAAGAENDPHRNTTEGSTP